MEYKNKIVTNFDQSMEAIILNSTMEISFNQVYKKNSLQQKSQTITYNHDKLVNIAKQVKNNISLRRMEFSIIKRVRELKLNRQGRQVEGRNNS